MPELSLKKKFLLFVGVPTLLASVYFFFLAADMYVSEAHFSIRGAESSGAPEWMAMFGQGGGSTTADAYIVQDYIRSMGLLTLLDEQLKLKEHYRGDTADFLSRLSANASAEEFLDHYRKVVKVTFDPVTGILSLRTRAYSPEMARDIGRTILEQSEKLVNDLRERALQDSLGLARTELSTAEERVTEVRENLKRFRQQSRQINPEAAAGAVLSLIAELEGETAKARIQLAESRSFMRDDSAQVASLRSRIAALESQIADEKSRLTGADSEVLNDVMADYERLMVEREFAEKHYVSALASLEAARIQAEGKSRYLVAFSAPSLPEESVWPRRFSFTGLVFVCSTLLFGIVSLVVAGIREHAGF